MDDKTRGIIENVLDETKKVELAESIKWVEETIPLSSLRDLVLGYALGIMEGLATSVVTLMKGRCTHEDTEDIRKILERRLPEILQKIEREQNI